MSLDAPSEPVLQAMLAGIAPEALGTEARLRAMLKADAGFVCWDARPPHGELWSVHRRTFMDAVYTGLSFCQTDTRDEWCVLGVSVYSLLRAHPDYGQCEPVVCQPLVFVGRVKTVSVYIPSVESHGHGGQNGRMRLDANEFYVGAGARCSRGLITNEPVKIAGHSSVNW